MKFGQLIEYNKSNIFLQKQCRKKGREASSRNLLLKKKKRENFVLGKSKWSEAQFQYILIALNLTYSQSKRYKTLAY